MPDRRHNGSRTLRTVVLVLLWLCSSAVVEARKQQPQTVVAKAPTSGLTVELRRAFVAGDERAVQRAAKKIPVATLIAAMSGTDRLGRLAAIAAAPAYDYSFAFVEALATAATHPDRATAVAATRSATEIARRFDATVRTEREITDAEVARAAAAWLAVGTSSGRWTDVRVRALENATTFAALLAESVLDVAALLDDPDPQIRRAAIEIYSDEQVTAQRDRIAKRVADDPDTTVAVVAAGVLCTAIRLGDPPAPILGAIGEPGLARLRVLVIAVAEPLPARYFAAHCLAADPSEASRTALDAFVKAAPPHLRDVVVPVEGK